MLLINARVILFFWEPSVTLHCLFEPPCLQILKENTVSACLIMPAPFWILLLEVSRKKVKSAEIAIKMLKQPTCRNPDVATQDKF